MGLKLLAALASAVALAALPGPLAAGSAYLLGHQQSDGGFAEPGGRSDPSLTAWAVLGLRAAGADPGPEAADYLAAQPVGSATDLALRILALRALGRDISPLADRLERLAEAGGRIGPLVNSTIWGVIALRAAGRAVPAGSVRYLLGQQHRSGGWAWYPDGSPDADDTAAAVQALRATGVAARSPAITRALAYLRRLQAKNGGFSLVAGRRPNTQSTAWAIQALVAAGADPGRRAFAFLERMRRTDGSFRYDERYAVTPVWVTSYAVAALARRPFPLA